MTRPIVVGRMLACLAVVSCVAFVGGAAAVPPQSGVIDLLTHPELRIYGQEGLAGWDVSAAGDVNGDGQMDLIVGEPYAGNNGRASSGSAYVVFGGFSMRSDIDLAALGPRGFRIDGAVGEGTTPWGDTAGSSVSSAGDVNGDGLADVLVGAPDAHANGRMYSGSVYVVFGKASLTTVDLAALGTMGFRIDGAAPRDRAGRSVAGGGDVNGDGRADVIVGAPTADPGGGGDNSAGSVYVIFGSASPTNIDLSELGNAGYRIDGAANSNLAGWSASALGDVNADGRADVLVGAPGATVHRGAAHVVYGKASTSPIDLATLGAGGFRIDGVAGLDRTGEAVSGAGDVNGDGLQDFVLGAPEADNNGRSRSGSAYVVFGTHSPTDVDLTTLGNGGFRIDGAAVEDIAGTDVSGAGDVNGDGLADVLIGAPFADNNGRAWSGSAYVVFGRASTTTIDLATLGTGGYRLDSAALADDGGRSVAAAGDLTGDGRAEVLMGVPRDTTNRARGDAGAVHVLSFGVPRLAYRALQATLGEPFLSSSPFQLETTGSYGFQVSPPLPAGLLLDPSSGQVVGTPTAVHARTAHTVTLEDLAGSATAQLVLTVGAAAIVDTAAPKVTLRIASPQRALRQRKIVLRASCNEACRLSAQGTIAIVGRSVRIPLRPASASRASAAERTLGLSLTKASLTRLAGHLAKGRRARATVTVTARDGAGNARAATRAIVVRR